MASASDVDLVREVFAKALIRMDDGRGQYGAFDPATDERDLFQEAEEELLDAMVYLGMLALQLRGVKAGIVDAISMLEQLDRGGVGHD